MADFSTPTHSHPALEFWEKSYKEFLVRCKGLHHNAAHLATELRHYAKLQNGKGVRILDVGGGDGTTLLDSLRGAPELKIDAITVVEPSQKYVDSYTKGIRALIEETKLTFRVMVGGYDLGKVKRFHEENGMDFHYDLVFLVHSIYYIEAGVQAVPELRDNFLEPKSGHLIVVCAYDEPCCQAQKFAAAHYEKFYPDMTPSTTNSKAAKDLFHYAIRDNVYMTSYKELFEVSDIVLGDDICSGNEKGRDFIRFFTQRDLDMETRAGDLELRLYVKWIKSLAFCPYSLMETELAESGKTSMLGAGVTESWFLPCSTINLFRLTSNSMKTLTATTAESANPGKS